MPSMSAAGAFATSR